MTLIGQTIGGYRITETVGQGGMAQVYKGYQPRLERWVAIKVLTPSFMEQAQFLERFRREARTLSVLRHPNILTVYDYGEENGLAYIVMEYVANGTLRARLGKPYTWPNAAALMIPICQALAYAHEQGIVHRDIKPANILMPREDWPLLGDFGLVKLVQSSPLSKSAGSGERLTQLGDSLGTPDYMSPEQAVGDETDHRADIYSVGIVLYEMLAGIKPYVGTNPLEVILKHLQEIPVPPHERNPAIPEPVSAVVLRAMSKTPEDRFASMAEFVGALQEVLERFPYAGHGEMPTPLVTPGASVAVVLGACPHCGAEVNLALAHCSHCDELIPAQRRATAGRLRAVHPPGADPSHPTGIISPAVLPFAQQAESLTAARLILEGQVELLIPPKSDALIGRADPRNQSFPEIDLAPHNGSRLGVSRNHARLVLKQGVWHVEDLQSTNGTFVNDQRLEPGALVPLKPGDIIRCGHLAMTFTL